MPEPDLPPLPPFPGEVADVGGGRRVFVRRAGAGAPLVLVHGFASTSVDWTDLMAELSDEYALHAVDLPGYGFSPPAPDGDYSLDAHAAAVTGLVAAVCAGSGPVVLAGNSLGGLLAIRIAERRPDLVAGLFLLAPALPGTRLSALSRLVPLPLLGGVGRRALGVLLHGVPAERRVRIRYEHDFHRPGRLHPDRWAAAIAEQRRHDRLPHAREAFFGTLAGTWREWRRHGTDSPWGAASRLTCPTLLLWGERDRMVDARLGGPAQRILKGSELVVLPECGHVPQMEWPRRSAEAFRAFHRANRAS